jgi:hypothetical protein
MLAPFDTVAAFTEPPYELSDDLFEGGSVTENFNSTHVAARLWKNPKKASSVYEPRVTYWRRHGYRVSHQRELGAAVRDPSDVENYPNGLLKLEFSLPQMSSGYNPLDNMQMESVDAALARVDAFAATICDGLPPVREWTCQRMDYTYNWRVGKQLREYMTVLQSLRVSGMHRHPFDANEGVVWKAKNRWIKFYNKSLQSGIRGSDEVLRFEVSNYKDALKYMCSKWFDCERTVGELLHPGRALYTMARMWDKLGLHSAETYGTDGLVHQKLVELFGHRGAQAAAWHLNLIRTYGTTAFSEGVKLTSKSSYYRWKTKLQDSGVITVFDIEGEDEAIDVIDIKLEPLELPLDQLFSAAKHKYLKVNEVAAASPSDKNSAKIFGIAVDLKSKTIGKYLEKTA